jgi:hypothetical protein
MARLNQEMAAAALAEAQAAETMPEPVAPRILPPAEPVENAVVAAEPVVPAFPAETRQELMVRVIAYLVRLPHRRFMPAAEIHAAIRPAMDVFDLNALLQYLGCNGEIDISEIGRREYEFRAHESDEPLDAVEEPAMDSMAWLNEPYTGADSTHRPSDDYDDVFSRPGEPDVPVQESFESMKAKQQAARHAEHAAVIDRIVRVDTTDAEQVLVSAAASVDTTDAEQAAVVAAPGVDSADAEQALVAAPSGVDTTDTEQAPVAAAAGADITDTEQALPSRYKVYRRCVTDFVDEVLVSEHFDPAEAISACDKEMFITVADGHSRKLLDAEKILQIRLLGDQAEMMVGPLGEAQRDKTRRGKRLVSKLLDDKAKVIQRIASLREVQVFVDTNDAQQTLVVAAPSRDPKGADELARAFYPMKNWLYHELVVKDLRVGRSIMVLPSGTEEVIRHDGDRGGKICRRVVVRRTNGLPQPVSGQAAAIFHHFIKIQYRDIRSSVIQEVLRDYVEGGETLDATDAALGDYATSQAELAFWLHCAETGKPCVCLADAGRPWDGSEDAGDAGEDADVQTFSRISVYCPQGFCFHPDVFFYISEILRLYAKWDRANLSVIEVSALCVGEGGEKAAQAIVKLFADTPSLLVKDMLFARYLESPSTTDATDHTPAPASSVNPSTNKNNTVVLRGKEYSLDTQGAEFLTEAFHISLPESKSILEGVSPDNWPEIVPSLRESRKSIKCATDKPAYIRGIVLKALTGNGNDQAQEPNTAATP